MSELRGACPICDGQVSLPADTQETEIITCAECSNRFVVTGINNLKLTLEEAPEIEEDWGE